METDKTSAPVCSVIGLICGIVSVVCLSLCCCCGGLGGPWISIIVGIAGIILSIIGNKQCKTGVGTAGLICSITGVVLGIIICIIGLIGGAGSVLIGTLGNQ